MNVITDKLKIHMDEEGNVIANNKSKSETDIHLAKKDMTALGETTS